MALALDAENLKRFDSLVLKHGSHSDFERGACIMEAVAFFAGEPFSDSPKCASPVISAFLRRMNDRLPTDELRTKLLKPLIPKLVGSKSTTAVERKRAYMAVDWAVRVVTPIWLELANFHEAAALLRDLAPIINPDTARTARDLAQKVRETTYEKRTAAHKKLAYADDAAAYAYAAYAYAYAADAAAAAAAAAAYAYAVYAAADAAVADAAVADAAVADAAAEISKGKKKSYEEWREFFRARMETALAPTVERTRLMAVELVEQMLAVVEA